MVSVSAQECMLDDLIASSRPCLRVSCSCSWMGVVSLVSNSIHWHGFILRSANSLFSSVGYSAMA